MNSDCVEIALPSDQNYFPGLLVTAFSMAKKASSQAHLSFNILDGGINDESFKHLQDAVLRVHPKSSFRRFKICEQDFSMFPSFHGNRMTYVRFMLPTLLPDAKFVIYADSDCLWLADVAELWQQRNAQVLIKAVFDEYGDYSEKPWFESRNLKWHENRYFCNGLLLMNLDEFRRQQIVQKAVEFIKAHADLQYADQSAFNAIIDNGVEILPHRWNFFTREIGRNTVKSPVVLHYANQLPWKRDQWVELAAPFMHLWHEMYKEANNGIGYDMLRRYEIFNKVGLSRLIRYCIPKRLFRWPLFAVLKLFRQDQMRGALCYVAGGIGRIIT